MRESRADTTQAVLSALALHALLIALAFAGLWWTREHAPQAAGGGPVEAELVAAGSLSARMQAALRERVQAPSAVEPLPQESAATPPPQPLPEPLPEEATTPPQEQAQDFVPEPAPVEQEEVRADALSAEARPREQERKQRQAQVDLTEQERQRQSEQKYRLAQQQLDAKLRRIEAERARQARSDAIEEQRLQQLADAQARQANTAAASGSAAPAPGSQGLDAGLAARYAAALQEAILRNWSRPESVPLGQRCRLNIKQAPGGQVIDVEVAASCPYDELGRRSVEAAVRKAEPLPYEGFEAVFRRSLVLNFEARDR